MQRLVWCVLVTVLLGAGSALQAQQNEQGHGYAIFGINSDSGKFGDALSAGGGGELYVWKGLAAGGDLVYFWPHVSPSDGIGLLSLGPAVHFRNADKQGRFVPFFNGGYGLAFRGESLNLWYLGGGANWWFSHRIGMRVEYRHYGWKGYRFDDGIRIGIAFR